MVCATVLTGVSGLQHIDPELGTELPERAYGGDCRLWVAGQGVHWQVLKDTLLDEFVIAHSLGWIGKAIIMRNYWMLWVCSIGFEFMELTFQHWLLNFNECWWDSWILDVALCNFGGLLLGMAAVRFFGSKKYDWQGMAQQKGLLNKAKCAPTALAAQCALKPGQMQWSRLEAEAERLHAFESVGPLCARPLLF